jgi:hypothetical protein
MQIGDRKATKKNKRKKDDIDLPVVFDQGATTP